MDQNQQDSTESTRYSITYSLDNDHCLRRECPSCGRRFKTRADEGDLVSAIRPAFQQLGVDIAPADETAQGASTEVMFCPYCGHSAPVGNMLTTQFADYLSRYITREYVLPRVNEMLSGFSEGLQKSSRRSSGGLLSVSIEAHHSRSIDPPRPISGPEPNDMSLVLMLCCGRVIKILEGWADNIVCPFCGQAAELQ